MPKTGKYQNASAPAKLKGSPKVQRRKLPVFGGVLAKPINLQGLAAVIDPNDEWVFNQQLDKLAILAAAYGYEDPHSAGDWAGVCLAMAKDFIPGFSVETRPKGRGRKNERRNHALICKKLDEEMRVNSITLAKAVDKLTKKDAIFSKYNPETLRRIYDNRKNDKVSRAVVMAEEVLGTHEMGS